MMLLHDVEEIITGDIIRGDKEKQNKDEVYKRELDAFKSVISSLPDNLQEKYIALWKEYAECKTPEALLAKSIDRIEMVIQAMSYFEKYPEKKVLKLFMDENDLSIVAPETQELIKLLLKRREEL